MKLSICCVTATINALRSFLYTTPGKVATAEREP